MNGTKVECPNCCEPAFREGNKITCEACDATFEFKKTGGAKVKELGRIESLEKRMDSVESLLPGQEPNPANLEPDPAANEPDPAANEPDPAAQETSLLG